VTIRRWLIIFTQVGLAYLNGEVNKLTISPYAAIQKCVDNGEPVPEEKKQDQQNKSPGKNVAKNSIIQHYLFPMSQEFDVHVRHY